MQLIKQRDMRDCVLCVAAMLLDRSYQAVLAENPDYEDRTDQGWIEYRRASGCSVLLLGRHRHSKEAQRPAS